MKKSILTRIVFAAISLPLLAGCVTRVVYTQPPPANPPPNAVVEQPSQPPTAQVDVIPPQPDVTFIWVPGAWEWRGGGWFWVHGYWGHRPHPGAVWVGGHWGWRGHRNVWVGGRWQ
ncbi:MAG TPA: hypothetical protein VGI03_16270 [Verrucomicrobiae bacterium]|jgi:hypothetical protein